MPTINSGNGTAVGVTSDRRVMAEAITRDYGMAVALEQGKAFCFADNAVTPTGAADVFARIAVTGTNESLVVTKVAIQSAGTENISLQLVANYTSATTHGEKTAQNRLPSAQATTLWTSYGTFESDVDITGDAGAVTSQVDQIAIPVADTRYELDLRANPIVVPTGYSLILESDTGTSALAYSVYGHLAAVPTTDE